MATFSNLGLKLISQGDEAGTWGTSTNTNLDIVDESLQYNSKNFTSDANLTITVANGTTGTSGSPSGREQVLEFTDTGSVLTASRSVIIQPSTLKKMWLVKNSTARSLLIKMSNGDSGVTILAGNDALLYSKGTGNMQSSVAGSPGVSSLAGTTNQVAVSQSSGAVTLSLDDSQVRLVSQSALTTGTTVNNIYNGTNYNRYKFTGSAQITVANGGSGNIQIQPISTTGQTGVGNYYSSGFYTDVSAGTPSTALINNQLGASWTIPLATAGSNNQIDIWWEINLARDTTYQSSNGFPYYGTGKVTSRSGLNVNSARIVDFNMGAANNGNWNTFGGLKFTTPTNVNSGHSIFEVSNY